MVIETLANYSEIFGTALVVVSLLFVGVQLRQNTKSSQSSARLGWASIQAEWHRHLAQDPEMSRIVQSGFQDQITQLTTDEQQRYRFWFIGYLHSWDAYFHEHSAGQIPDEFYASFERLLAGFFEVEANRDWWRAEEGRYTSSFTRWISDLTERSPDDRWTYTSSADVFKR